LARNKTHCEENKYEGTYRSNELIDTSEVFVELHIFFAFGKLSDQDKDIS
jgi:hypothetical protein